MRGRSAESCNNETTYWHQFLVSLATNSEQKKGAGCHWTVAHASRSRNAPPPHFCWPRGSVLNARVLSLRPGRNGSNSLIFGKVRAGYNLSALCGEIVHSKHARTTSRAGKQRKGSVLPVKEGLRGPKKRTVRCVPGGHIDAMCSMDPASHIRQNTLSSGKKKPCSKACAWIPRALAS